MDINIKEHENQGFKVITFKGRFDAHNSDAIENKLNSIIDANTKKFIVDVGDVDYLGSCGIRIFISITHRLRDSSGALAIVNMIPSCMKILQAMEIEHLFHLFNSENEAVRFLQA